MKHALIALPLLLSAGTAHADPPPFVTMDASPLISVEYELVWTATTPLADWLIANGAFSEPHPDIPLVIYWLEHNQLDMVELLDNVGVDTDALCSPLYDDYLNNQISHAQFEVGCGIAIRDDIIDLSGPILAGWGRLYNGF